MPLYEYQCASCRKIHEVMQKFSDEPLTECPECKGSLSKLMSMSSFALKGSGWYTTDYKRKTGGSSGEAGTAKANEPSPPKTEPAATSTGSDSKK